MIPTHVPARPQGHLQLHDIAAGRGAHQAGAHVLGIAVQGTDVARVLVVIHHLPKKQRQGVSGNATPLPLVPPRVPLASHLLVVAQRGRGRAGPGPQQRRPRRPQRRHLN